MSTHVASEVGSAVPAVKKASLLSTCSDLLGQTVFTLSHKARTFFVSADFDFFSQYLRNGRVGIAKYLTSSPTVSSTPAPILELPSVPEPSISAELHVPDAASEQPADTTSEPVLDVVSEPPTTAPSAEQPSTTPTEQQSSAPRRPQRPRRVNPLFGSALLANTLAPRLKTNAIIDQEAEEARRRGAALVARAPAAAKPVTTTATEPVSESPVVSPRGAPARKVQGARHAAPARSPRDVQPRAGAGLSAPAAEAAASMPRADAGAVVAGCGEAQAVAVAVLAAPAAAAASGAVGRPQGGVGPLGRVTVTKVEDLSGLARERLNEAVAKMPQAAEGREGPIHVYRALARSIMDADRTNEALNVRLPCGGSGKKKASGAQGSCASLDKRTVKDA